MNKSKKIHKLLNINMALHYKGVDQIDWPAVLGARQVVLVFTPTFIRGLEKNKAHNPSKKLRKRASQYISWLAEAARTTQPYIIHEGVTIKSVSHDPDS